MRPRIANRPRGIRPLGFASSCGCRPVPRICASSVALSICFFCCAADCAREVKPATEEEGLGERRAPEEEAEATGAALLPERGIAGEKSGAVREEALAIDLKRL